MLWNFHCFQRRPAPRYSRAVIHPEAFAFVTEGKTVGFVPSLWRGVETATGVGGGFPAEGCTFSSVTLSDFHLPFPISQITAL